MNGNFFLRHLPANSGH